MPAKPPEKNPETNADNNQSASESLDIRESQSERLSAAAETQVGTAERSSVKEADERDSVQNNLPEATEAEEVRDALQNLFDRAKQAEGPADASGNGKGQEAAKPPGNIHGYDSHLGDISGRELNLPQFGRVLISEAKSGSGSKTEFKELDNAPKLDGRTIEAITYRPGQDTLVKFADAKEPESISTSPPEELFQFKNGDTSVIVRSDGSKVVGPTTIYHPQDAEGRLKTERKDGYSETSFKDGSYRFEFDPPGDDRLNSATVSPDGSFKAEYQREDGTFAISESGTRRTETLTKGSGDFETVSTDLETGRQQLSGAEQGRRYEGDRWTGSDDQIVTQKQYEDGAVVTSFEGRPHASGADEIVFKDGKLTFIKDGKEFEPENQSDIVHSVQMRDGSQRVVRADGALDAAPASEPVAEAIAEPVVDPISEPAAVPYLTVGNELSSFSESEYDRRSV
ncbi:MAG: hypothetical protein KC652_27350, partial [Cyanobacteria bacterium HKST-UBA01]|nr:hypothetical protein [Cyanobacteria bacterium HKST-UBA01]